MERELNKLPIWLNRLDNPTPAERQKAHVQVYATSSQLPSDLDPAVHPIFTKLDEVLGRYGYSRMRRGMSRVPDAPSYVLDAVKAYREANGRLSEAHNVLADARAERAKAEARFAWDAGT